MLASPIKTLLLVVACVFIGILLAQFLGPAAGAIGGLTLANIALGIAVVAVVATCLFWIGSRWVDSSNRQLVGQLGGATLAASVALFAAGVVYSGVQAQLGIQQKQVDLQTRSINDTRGELIGTKIGRASQLRSMVYDLWMRRLIELNNFMVESGITKKYDPTGSKAAAALELADAIQRDVDEIYRMLALATLPESADKPLRDLLFAVRGIRPDVVRAGRWKPSNFEDRVNEDLGALADANIIRDIKETENILKRAEGALAEEIKRLNAELRALQAASAAHAIAPVRGGVSSGGGEASLEPNVSK